MYSVFKKELIAYFSSLVAYITIGLFLLVLGLFLWVYPETSLLDYGYAGLDSLFNIAPYLFMFLIPAITMRTLAGERREGTFELLVTRPLTDVQIVLGKYLACVILLLFALLPTLIYYFTISILGSPQGNIDTGGVTGSYIGLFLLGCAFTNIGIFASAITKNQVIAFALAIFLCFFFFTGFDSLSGLVSFQNYQVAQLGINAHYQSVSRGVLDTRDLSYFIALSTLFFLLTMLMMTWQRGRRLNRIVLLVSAAIIIVFVFFTNTGFTRFDFTKEKRYTISAFSRGVMDNLNQPVKITLYLKGTDFPAGMKRLQQATGDMLSDLQAYSHGRLQFDLVDPLKFSANANEQEQFEQNLEARGLEPTRLSVASEGGQTQKLIYPGALVTVNQHDMPVNFLQTREGLTDDEQLNISIQNLEYAFISTISKAEGGNHGLVGFTSGHDELNDKQLTGAKQALSGSGYQSGRFHLADIPFDTLKNVSLVIVAKPQQPFTELEKYKLDQYIMQGGHVIWCIDQVNADLDSLRGRGGELAFSKKLNLDDMLFNYGIRLNYDLIADMNCAQIPITIGNQGGRPQMQMLPWLFYPLFLPMSKHPAVKNLDAIRSEFAGTIDTIGINGIKKTILFTSSPVSKKFNVPYLVSLQATEQTPDPRSFQSAPKTTSVLLEGKFKSVFLNRPVPEGLKEHIAQLSEGKPAKMVVISDGDIFKNQQATDGSPYPLGYDRYSQKTYGNKNLLLNLADYLTGDARLITLRDKEVQLRLLDRPRVRNEKLYWQLVNTTGPLLLLTVFAIFQHYWRRRKYAY